MKSSIENDFFQLTQQSKILYYKRLEHVSKLDKLQSNFETHSTRVAERGKGFFRWKLRTDDFLLGDPVYTG